MSYLALLSCLLNLNWQYNVIHLVWIAFALNIKIKHYKIIFCEFLQQTYIFSEEKKYKIFREIPLGILIISYEFVFSPWQDFTRALKTNIPNILPPVNIAHLSSFSNCYHVFTLQYLGLYSCPVVTSLAQVDSIKFIITNVFLVVPIQSTLLFSHLLTNKISFWCRILLFFAFETCNT